VLVIEVSALRNRIADALIDNSKAVV
jgi:hypothetical protein